MGTPATESRTSTPHDASTWSPFLLALLCAVIGAGGAILAQNLSVSDSRDARTIDAYSNVVARSESYGGWKRGGEAGPSKDEFLSHLFIADVYASHAVHQRLFAWLAAMLIHYYHDVPPANGDIVGAAELDLKRFLGEQEYSTSAARQTLEQARTVSSWDERVWRNTIWQTFNDVRLAMRDEWNN